MLPRLNARAAQPDGTPDELLLPDGLLFDELLADGILPDEP
jgi:hypothetical protein